MPYADINGLNIYYEEFGRGETVLFLHSHFSRGLLAFSGQILPFSGKYRCLFPDFRGHGRTTCDDLTWNSRMGRWVNRGAKGIALIDDSGPRKRLRYVFDISDTHMVRGGKTPYLWQMDTQLRSEMADYLMDTYGSIRYAESRAEEYAHQALDLLSTIDFIQDSYRPLFREMVDFILHRGR